MPSPGPFSTHHPHIDILLQASVTFALKNILSALMGGCQEMPEDRHTLELTSATNKWILEDKYSKFLIPWEKEL